MGLTGKHMQEENRSLLQRSKAFSKLEKNSFVKSPDFHFQGTKVYFNQLEKIKSEKVDQTRKTRRLVILFVILLLITIVTVTWLIT